MTDDQLLRYSRHILLEEIGIDGQERFNAAHALIVGAGGLGSPVALYLASAGLGQITLIDDDKVDLTNLQRQIAHTVARIGQPKADSARAAMEAINPLVEVHALAVRADADLLGKLLPQTTVVVDCCDNFATRQMLNSACVQAGVPLVSGAAIRMDAQLAVYDPCHAADSPCYACVFDPEQAPEETRCATLGVFAPLVGVVGSMQAAMALQVINGQGKALTKRLWMIDGRTLAVNEIGLTRRPQCPVCGAAGSAH